MIENMTFLRLFTACALALALVAPASALDIAGVKIDDTSMLAGTSLKLNGAGVRTKVVFKVYVAALYLSEKKTTLQEINALAGPRRMMLVMLRDLSAEDFTDALMKGLNSNTDKAELARLNGQVTQLGQILAGAGNVKKGDTLMLDWLPGEGTVTQLNGKKLGAAMPDVAFYNALLRIWLGDKPADNGLKPQLLGEKG